MTTQLEKNNSEQLPINLESIREAQERIRGVISRTSLVKSPFFSGECGAEVYLKLENLQQTGSFKIRGASNKVARLLEAARQAGEEPPLGVIAASAGNHAQGVAYAAAYNHLAATVVMAQGASLTKIKSCQEMGATVIQYGSSLEEAATFARNQAAETGFVFLHPYDDWDVITGQATLGLELLEDLPDLTTAVIPLGGGGLLGGTAMALKLQNPNVRVIGVQTEAVSPYLGYIQSGNYTPIQPNANTIADGIKVKLPGAANSAIIRRYVDDVVTVDDNQISEAIVALLERTRTIGEGAGAVALAAMIHKKVPLGPNEKVAVVISGGNIDSTLVGRIIDFGLVSSGRYVSVAVTVPDTPGTLVHLLTTVAELGMNVRQVEHRRGELHIPVGKTEIILQIETKDWDQQAELFRRFAEEGLYLRNLLA
ncbi:MAG: threonine ammonia-lyase [Chloroflexi bacterium]|nr:threonine ammonia-lyase [Chloroflexota bacterium]OJV93661.1 MAG: threonine ammonia-lyase [Chloroflexi bacterium 54-19]